MINWVYVGMGVAVTAGLAMTIMLIFAILEMRKRARSKPKQTERDARVESLLLNEPKLIGSWSGTKDMFTILVCRQMVKLHPELVTEEIAQVQRDLDEAEQAIRVILESKK